MRIAALYDIHGNRPALDAVLAEIDREKVDVILVGGDIAWGPFPRETIERLQELPNATFVRGNADREVAEGAGIAEGLDDTTASINEWAADQLTDEQRRWLGTLRTSFLAKVEEIGEVVFCHGSPRSDEEPLTPLTPPARVLDVLQDLSQTTIVCGHTHVQFRRDFEGRTIINPGSVGMPYQGKPGAFWALLGPQIQFRRTAYDIETATAAMRDSGCPHVEEVFVDTLFNPPTTDEVARHFEAVAANRNYSPK